MQAEPNKKLLLFGGQFDPVHIEHIRILQSAIAFCNPHLVKVVPSYQQSKKSLPIAPFCKRVEMLKLALKEFNIQAEVDEIERELANLGNANGYTVHLLQDLQRRYPNYTIYLLIGADQFLSFENWYMPQKIVQLAKLIVASRKPYTIDEQTLIQFKNRFGEAANLCAYAGVDISSTNVQCKLAFAKPVDSELPIAVTKYLQQHTEIYQPDRLQKGLQLLSPMRLEHSFRVAKMAMQSLSLYNLDRKQLLYAAALHDIAKNIPASHPLLQAFIAPENMTDKNPVWHAFAGAYLAEHYLKITDRAVIDAIAYHTTGKAAMSLLEKVIYLADMLEEQRNFKNIAYLRQFYPNNIDKCLAFALQYTIHYLKDKKVEVFYLTEEAWEYYKSNGDA